MSASRLEMDRLQELVRLHRLGTGPREVARLLGMSPNTERRYREQLIAAGLLDGTLDDLPSLATLRAAVENELGPRPTPEHERSSVEAWLDRIEELWRGGAGPQAIFDRLRLERDDFAGSLSAIKRLCLRLKKAKGVAPNDVGHGRAWRGDHREQDGRLHLRKGSRTMNRMQRWVQQATIVAALAATAGCGPSSNAPEPDWFVRAWFQWDECFEDDPEFCQVPYVTTLTVAEDGSATLDRERVCNIEAPTDLVWGEEDERAVVLESSEPGAPFHWDVSTPQQVLFSYEGECKAKAELVEDPAAGDSETTWHAGEVGFQRFSPTDCIGTVVSTTDDPCVKDFPKGFPSP